MEKKTYKGGVGLRREIRILAILLSASVFFAACAGKEEPEKLHTRQPIEFVVGQEYAVKSTDTSFETGDRISLFAGEPVNADNVCLTCSGGKLVSEKTLYWGEGQTSATDFTAIYPYSEDYLFAEGFSFTVEADQSSRSAHCASDLMVATTSAAPSAGPVALNFSHVLSRLALQIDNRTGKKVSSVILSGVKLGYEYPDALASGEEGSICAYPASEDTWEVILPPDRKALSAHHHFRWSAVYFQHGVLRRLRRWQEPERFCKDRRRTLARGQYAWLVRDAFCQRCQPQRG